MLSSENPDSETIFSLPEHKFLNPSVITAIEEALNKVGAFGEVHLIIERGNLRFIRTIRSEAIDHTKE